MIKFFRKIRQNLLAEGKIVKYIKYAIGEIILVMIGILLALTINSWNQNRLNSQQESVYLANLKNDLLQNIERFNYMDSIFNSRQSDIKSGLEIFNSNPSIYDFKKIDSLIRPYWAILNVNRNTFNEMLSNGSFYRIHNLILKEKISNHYWQSKLSENTFLDINSKGQDITFENKDLYPLEVLRDRLQLSPVKLKGIDTTWIHNLNSPIYTGFLTKARFYERTNETKLGHIKNIINSCKNLIEAIDVELNTRNND
jgi:hypothetical protein